MSRFEEKSYDRHRAHYAEHTADGEERETARTWLRDDTVDAWRHRRIQRSIDPILQTETDSTWVTVGDGRYGREAKYILDSGHRAVATDISVDLLEEAAEMGRIDEYSQENAEFLSFEDSAFDYAFCKSSLHHFPRPYLALYELLRVAKKGVVVIEPTDPAIREHLVTTAAEKGFDALKDVAEALFDRDLDVQFEESGNYVYKLSRRELEKVALGLNYDTIAFRGLNDCYVSGVEFEELSEQGPLQKKVKRVIALKNALCRLNLTDYGLLATAIFKRRPGDDTRRGLADAGYDVNDLPDNPYIDGE